MNHQVNKDPKDAVTDGATSAAVIADLVARHVRHKLIQLDHPDLEFKVPALVLPNSLSVQSIDKLVEPYLPRPRRRKGLAKVSDVESFISLVNRFKDEHSALFADADAPHLLAVLDYNEANPKDDDGIATGAGLPRFGGHRVLYNFPVSDEWEAWREKNGEWFTQTQFAEFIDDRLLDVGTPENPPPNVLQFMERLGVQTLASPTRLLELSRGLTVHINDRTAHRVNPSTGETVLSFEATHNTNDAESGAPITVPRAFILAIPVFRDGTAYRLPVRLKYRAGSGQIAWSYEIHDMDRAFDLAFREACAHAEDDTRLPLYFGSPEV